MTSRKPSRDFLFIDESGDPGYLPGSSKYFAVGCLHLTDIGLEELQKHFCAFGYFQTKFREIKSSKLSGFQKDQIADMLKWLQCKDQVAMSVVFVDKDRYTGPYLRPVKNFPANPVYFRNFLNRQLFEKHFANNPLITNESAIIFDHTVSETEETNLKSYLRGNLLLPRLDTIVQCDSRYVPSLQFADVMIHIVKETHFGDPGSVDGRLLEYMNIFDVSQPTKAGRHV